MEVWTSMLEHGRSPPLAIANGVPAPLLGEPLADVPQRIDMTARGLGSP